MTDEAEPASLHAIAALASGTDDPSAATRDILALLVETFSAESGLIAFQNPESGRLEIEASRGLPEDGDRSIPPGQGVPGWVAWRGQALLVEDASSDPRSRPLRPAARSEMAAPMLLPAGEVLGVIALDRNAPGAFGPADLALLVRLAGEAARVLSRLWELRHLRGKARQLEALIATGQALVGKLEQRELFSTLTRDAAAMLQARTCAFFLHDPGAGLLRLAAYSGDADSLSHEGDLPLQSCLSAAAV